MTKTSVTTNEPIRRAKAENVEPASTKTRKQGIGRSGTTPLAAIRNKCLDCCCWLPSEVRDCVAVECSLHPYRFGKRPATVARRKAKKEQA